ncbi:MAG: hypothetical protein UW70_C0041G0007 [Candidatus Peregrinibacteria bacterium GW2011_GWA2_44_7]|nr:MAG: hypothetical protein UW70_C0041G0007 [Candidatus Peregrinibacteria bacterium GW2011_GWA2_44_7]
MKKLLLSLALLAAFAAVPGTTQAYWTGQWPCVNHHWLLQFQINHDLPSLCTSGQN